MRPGTRRTAGGPPRPPRRCPAGGCGRRRRGASARRRHPRRRRSGSARRSAGPLPCFSCCLHGDLLGWWTSSEDCAGRRAGHIGRPTSLSRRVTRAGRAAWHRAPRRPGSRRRCGRRCPGRGARPCAARRPACVRSRGWTTPGDEPEHLELAVGQPSRAGAASPGRRGRPAAARTAATASGSSRPRSACRRERGRGRIGCARGPVRRGAASSPGRRRRRRARGRSSGWRRRVASRWYPEPSRRSWCIPARRARGASGRARPGCARCGRRAAAPAPTRPT